MRDPRVGAGRHPNATDPATIPAARVRSALARVILLRAMPVITGLVPAPDRPGYVTILVDGEPFATVAADVADALSLAPGVAAERAASVAPQDPATRRTYERALNMLDFRERSARDLRARLVAKGEPEAQVVTVIERLAAGGLLDDARLAREHARAALAGRGRSPRRVKAALARKGVASEVADAAVARVMASEKTDELALATAAARKKLRSLAALSRPEHRQKLYGYLARQGFSPPIVGRAIERAEADPEGEGDAG